MDRRDNKSSMEENEWRMIFADLLFNDQMAMSAIWNNSTDMFPRLLF